jgi:hypothetical protein
LTDSAIRSAIPRKGPYERFNERGLFLLVAPAGARWWRLKFRIAGKEKLLSVGVYPDVASTLLNEQGWNRDAMERQVAHGERDEVRAAYNYAQHLPERRKMIRSWADFLDALRVGAMSFRRRRRPNSMAIPTARAVCASAALRQR